MDEDQYLIALKGIRDSIPADKTGGFDMLFTTQLKNPGTALALGFFNIGRFYIGDIWYGIFMWLSCLIGIGVIWWFIDLFFISAAARRKNIEIAQQTRTMVG